MRRILIGKECLSDLKNWFANYASTFRCDDTDVRQNIDLKEMHTMRVCGEILHIGEKEGLSDDELRLAETIALFHDVGRFEQYARYRTFMDWKSENHAELGAKILEKHGVLDSLDIAAKDIVLRAVKHHNRPSLPREESDSVLLFSKLIRDADKLDIWKVVTDYYHRKDPRRNAAVELDLPDTPGFSEEVFRSLANKRIVNIKDVKNLNDFKLLQIGWIFDVNFKPTLQRVKERGYLESIRDVLPESKEIDLLLNTINVCLDG